MFSWDHHSSHLIPKTAMGRVAAVFVVCIPMLGLAGLAFTWFYVNKQALELSELARDRIKQQTLQIGKLIISFNTEREMTVTYVSARTMELQSSARQRLDAAYRSTDRSLTDLEAIWPSSLLHGEGQMFRSPHLFAAMLGSHRGSVKAGAYFWDELQFYTDVIDTLLGWLNRDVDASAAAASSAGPSVGSDGRGRLFGLLHSYGYLMGTISYLGAEQALCSAFHSVICFSHRETFYFANFSFSAEAIFRLYRQSYPFSDRRPDDWRTASHRSFFPELHYCRQEILTDMDYIGMSSDPSLCSQSRKNETRIHEVEMLSDHETNLIADELNEAAMLEVESAALRATLSAVVLTVAVGYVIAVHALRCACVRYFSVRLKKERKAKRLAKLQENSDADLHNSAHNYHPHLPHPNNDQHLQLSPNICVSDSEQITNVNNDLFYSNHKPETSFAALKVASV